MQHTSSSKLRTAETDMQHIVHRSQWLFQRFCGCQLFDYPSPTVPRLLSHIRFFSDSFGSSTHQSESCQNRVRFSRTDWLCGLSKLSRFLLSLTQAASRRWLSEKDARSICRHIVKDALCFCILCTFQTANIVHSAIMSITLVLCVPSCKLSMSHVIAAV